MAILPRKRATASTLPIEVQASAKQRLGMAPAAFLRDYWQKRPLLIRGAFADLACPITPEDLAGLACEEGALSRLVLHDRRYAIDETKARAEIGYVPQRGFEEGLRQTLRWYLDHEDWWRPLLAR